MTTHRRPQPTENPDRVFAHHRLLRNEERMTTESTVSQLSGILHTTTDMWHADGPSLIARAVAHTWPCPPFTFRSGTGEKTGRRQVIADWVADCAEEPSLLGPIPALLRTAAEEGKVPPDVPATGITRIVLFSRLWAEPRRDVLLNSLRALAQCLYVAGATDSGALVVTPSSNNPYAFTDPDLAEDLYQKLRIPVFTRELRVAVGGNFEFCRAIERFGFDR